MESASPTCQIKVSRWISGGATVAQGGIPTQSNHPLPTNPDCLWVRFKLPLPYSEKGRRMIAKIVHFGIDCRYRLHDLRDAGYVVESCYTVSELRLVLYVNRNLDAIIIDASERQAPKNAIDLARSHCPDSVVLFQGWTPQEDESDFDLIIPPLTPVPKWLDDLASLVTRTRAGRAQAREKSAPIYQSAMKS